MYTLTKQAIASGWLSGEGPLVARFEKEFADYIGMPFALATNSGTTALHLVIAALGIEKGDEVIVPALTIASCYFAVMYTGATPVPVDVDKDTYTLDVRLLEKAITKRTKAIMTVHLYGHPCDMDPILAIAKKHHLYVVEDAAEAHGAQYKGKRVGSLGDISVFSFYANKIVTCGEGGMVLTKNKIFYERMKRLKSLCHSKNRRFVHDGVGYNYQLSNVQAALGLASLSHIDKSLKIKRRMATLYQILLHNTPGLVLPKEMPWAKNVYWMYAVCINKKLFGYSRDEAMKLLTDKGVQTRTFFFSPKTAYRKLHLFQHGRYPVAERLEREGLYLPSGLGTSTKDLQHAAKTVLSLARRHT